MLFLQELIWSCDFSSLAYEYGALPYFIFKFHLVIFYLKTLHLCLCGILACGYLFFPIVLVLENIIKSINKWIAFLHLRLSWLPLHSTYRIFSLDTEFWVDSSFLSTLKNMVPLLLAWETLALLCRAGCESWLSIRPPLIPSLWGGEEYCSLYCWWGGKPGSPSALESLPPSR